MEERAIKFNCIALQDLEHCAVLFIATFLQHSDKPVNQTGISPKGAARQALLCLDKFAFPIARKAKYTKLLLSRFEK